MLTVAAIIAILLSIGIVTFSGQAKKAKAAVDMANIRSAKAAAAVEYLMTRNSETVTYYFDASTGTVTADRTAAAAFTGYGKSTGEVEGASGLPVKDGKPQILAVTVKMGEAAEAAWGLGNDLDTFLKKAIAAEAAFGGRYHSGNSLINAVGTLPSVSVSEIFGAATLYDRETILYWRPGTVTINGVKTVFLYAGGSASGSNNWQGYAVYCSGTVYKSSSVSTITTREGRIAKNSVAFPAAASDSDFEAYLLAHNWVRAG